VPSDLNQNRPEKDLHHKSKHDYEIALQHIAFVTRSWCPGTINWFFVFAFICP